LKYTTIFLFLQKPKIVPLSEAQISFESEVRARGIKGKVFRIRQGDKSVVNILNGSDGWSENKLVEMFEQLKQLKNY